MKTTTTPDGIACCWGKPKSAAWFDERSEGITATDISALTGRNKWKTPLDVWVAKTQTQRDKDIGEAGQWGSALEAPIVRRYARDHKTTDVYRPQHFGSVIANKDEPVARASLDAIGTDHDGPEVVEIKTAGARAMHAWEGGAAPVQYIEQVQWQMLTTGIPRARICVLLAGQKYEERVIWADEDWQAAALDLALEWWRVHIVGGLMPDPDPVQDANLMPTLWTPEPDKTIDLDPGLWEKYHKLRVEATAAVALETAVKTKVQVAMGDADTAIVDGETVATWRATKGRRGWDGKQFALDHPELVPKYTTHGQPSRRFNETKGKK